MPEWNDLQVLDADVTHLPSMLFSDAANVTKATVLNNSFLTDAKNRIEDRVNTAFASEVEKFAITGGGNDPVELFLDEVATLTEMLPPLRRALTRSAIVSLYEDRERDDFLKERLKRSMKDFDRAWSALEARMRESEALDKAMDDVSGENVTVDVTTWAM